MRNTTAIFEILIVIFAVLVLYAACDEIHEKRRDTEAIEELGER